MWWWATSTKRWIIVCSIVIHKKDEPEYIYIYIYVLWKSYTRYTKCKQRKTCKKSKKQCESNNSTHEIHNNAVMVVVLVVMVVVQEVMVCWIRLLEKVIHAVVSEHVFGDICSLEEQYTCLERSKIQHMAVLLPVQFLVWFDQITILRFYLEHMLTVTNANTIFNILAPLKHIS